MTQAIEPDFWVKGFAWVIQQGWFSSLTAMAYSPHTDCLAVAGGDGRILLLDLRSLECTEPRRLESGIRALCFAGSGHLLAGLQSGAIVSISHQGVQLLSAQVSRKPITALACSDVFGLIAASEDRQLRRLNPATLMESTAPVKQRWVGHDLAWLDHGRQLVVAGSDNNLHLIDPELLAPLLVIHAGTSRQTHTTAGHGQLVTAGQDGVVTLLDAGTHLPACQLPIANGQLAGAQIAENQPSLFLADPTGAIQEWDLRTLEPQSALQVEGSTKALSLSPSGDVLAICTDRSVQVFLRGSRLDALAVHQQELARRGSFLGVIVQLFRRLLGRPLPALPAPPQLPKALAQASLHTDPEIRSIERSTSDALVRAYHEIAVAARKVDWQALGQAIDKQHRHQLEAQRLELRRLREERLSRALDEAQKRREFHQSQIQKREQALRQARAEQRNMQFLDDVGKWLGRAISDSVTSRSEASPKQGKTSVSSYTRKDGTRVKSHKRG